MLHTPPSIITHSEKPKLVHITTVGITPWTFLRGQNRYMQSRGFEVHVVASPDEYLQRLARRDGALVHGVRMARKISPAADCWALLQLFFLLRKIKPQIVQVSTSKAALLGALAAWAAQVPIRIYLMRGLNSESTRGVLRLILRCSEKLVARICQQTICVSPSLLQFAREQNILRPDQGVVMADGMSNGIDATHFDPDRVSAAEICGINDRSSDIPPLVIGFVGRLARDKGIEELFAAWKTLRQEREDLRLLLVGGWEKTCTVAPSVQAALENDARVHLAGHVEDVAPYYRLMSLFVFPSHGGEGFPNAPMEAAAMGLPVVATSVVGCVDAVEDNVTGKMVPRYDVDRLTHAIRDYLSSNFIRHRAGQAGRERVEKLFSRPRIWRALDAEYQRLLARAGLHTAVPVTSVESDPLHVPRAA